MNWNTHSLLQTSEASIVKGKKTKHHQNPPKTTLKNSNQIYPWKEGNEAHCIYLVSGQSRFIAFNQPLVSGCVVEAMKPGAQTITSLCKRI